MKKITAFVGSARKKNTYQAVEQYLHNLQALGEIAGNFQINAPVPLTSDLQGSALQTKISQQANLLAFVALAQSEDQAGRTLEALEYYLKAADLAPDSDLLQFFIGREYLFSIERRPIPPEADAAFEQRAVDALQKALQLNPHNSQAYIALGTVYIKQAQPIIANTTSAGLTDSDFAKVAGLLDKAQAAYEQVLQPGFSPSESGVPTQDVARRKMERHDRLCTEALRNPA